MGGRVFPAAKFAVPPLPAAFVRRDRLAAVLDLVLVRPLGVVVGGPGAGKTVAIADWVRRRTDVNVAWVTLEPADNNTSRLCASLIASLGSASHSGRTSPHAVIEALTAADAAGPRVLVLDGVDQLSANTAAAILDPLLAQREPPVHVVLCGRADPPLPLTRLRLRGALVEVREGDLRFRPSEVDDFMRLYERRGLARTGIIDLVERVEGWPAGLALATLAVRGQGEPASTRQAPSGPPAAIADYLVGEVLDRLDPSFRDFLVTTSVLDLLEPRECDALTGRTDSALLLRTLASEHLFIARIQPGVYRCHQLLRAVLRGELETRMPAHARVVHARAASLAERHGQADAAIAHHVAAGSHPRALQVVAREGMPAFDAGDRRLLTAWLRQLRVPDLDGDGWALLDRAWLAMLAGARDDAASDLLAAERVVPASGPMRGALAALRSRWYAWCGEPAAVLSDATTARVELDGTTVRWAPDGLAAAVSFALLLSGDFDAAHRSADVLTTTDGAPQWYVDVARPGLMAAAACLAGRIGVARTLSVAADRAAAALSLRDDHPARYPGRLAFGGVLVERNALASAADVLDDLAVVTTRTGWRGFAVLARTELARVRAAQSRVDAARAQLRHARATDDGRPLSPELISRIDAAGARILVDRGDVRAARRLVDRLPPCPETTLLQARVALGSGDPARAADLVDTVATSRVVPRLRVQAGCLAARVAAVADPSDGTARLRDALDLPHAGEMHRVFADEGPWVAETLRAASHPVARAIASNLPRPDGDSHVRLSDRERVILEYLPTRLSNQDIAAELYVSLNTVKTHLKNIYRKLDATTRNEAVAHAAAGGLLDAPDGTFTSDV